LVASIENLIALNFYRCNGFCEFGRVKAGYFIDGREIDEVIMALRIDG
jgi:ribosomal protein S18 acetylase RimI-like enzyme